MKLITRSLLTVFVFAITCAFRDPEPISLAGKWRFAIDRDDKGVVEKWFAKRLSDDILLPGSMAENGKGDDITLRTKWTASVYDSSFFYNPRLAKFREAGNIKVPFFLTPAKHYVGAAWYQKEVSIPATWSGKHVILYLERAHTETRVWVDDREAGLQNSLVAPHEYDLTSLLSPGKHVISVRIDNRIKDINVGADAHSVSDHTQGNWNGLIGKLQLAASSPVYFTDIQIYPDVKAHSAKVRLSLANSGTTDFKGSVTLSAKSVNGGTVDETKTISVDVSVDKSGTATKEITLPFGEGMRLWDEFNPNLYQLTAIVDNGGSYEHVENRQFGMREFRIEGTKFLINGRPVFLRGTVNCCEFPLTGYPSMGVADWRRIFRIAKAHGLNHMRFHSWCPPEAAFMAADEAGFYLMPEGPSWPNHGPSIGRGQPIDQYLYDETERMAKYYGNYASFTMLSAGNEPAGNQVAYLNSFVDYWKKKDNRRVYTGMSVGGSWPVIPNAEFQVRGGVRGLAWDKQPETLSDFSDGITKFNVPFVAHEMGQWCVFPDFDEIKKYTGVYKARNFELFQGDLNDRGMGSQWKDFHLASGKLQLLCYKNEIEKALRTPGYGGFELLGLEDFPGQGTALVGTVNVFWEDKAYTSAKLFSRFCNSTVPLARIQKFVYTNDETFEAAIDLFHSAAAPLQNAVVGWSIRDERGNTLSSGAFPPKTFDNGNGLPAGKLRFSLSAITKPTKLTLEAHVENSGFANDWDFWVYPAKADETTVDVYYTTSLDDKARSVLAGGGKVFLNAADKVIKGKEVVMHFLPVFWNTSWFKMRPPHVTGMLIDRKSEAFADFPTDYHSDLQWWDIANRSQVMLLEDFPAGFKPLVQPIDTWFLNRRLALVYEARVGKGKIIVTSADLRKDTDRPASKQLYLSLMNYMGSTKFNPNQQISLDLISDVFMTPTKERFSTFTTDSPDELKPNSNQNKPKP